MRLVDSWHLDEERRTGRTSTVGFATRVGGPIAQLWSMARRRFRNPANTSVMWWNDRLLALYEGGAPTAIDPDTLEAQGTTDLAGALDSPFSAHPSTAPDGTTYNFGVSLSRVATLRLYRLGERAECVRSFVLRGHPLVHDFVVTDHYAIFFVSPLRMNGPSVLVGWKTPLEALEWRPEEGTDVYVVPLDSSAPIACFSTDPFYQWHFANAYEEGRTIVVDFVRYDDFTTNDFLSALFERRAPEAPADGALVRRAIDLDTGAMTEATLFSRSCEFPRIDPADAGRPHRYVYLAAHSTRERAFGGFDELVRVDVETGRAEPYALGHADFVSEPVYANGYLLAYVYDDRARRTHLAILDADRPHRPPVARCGFDQPLPPTFHGFWRDAVVTR